MYGGRPRHAVGPPQPRAPRVGWDGVWRGSGIVSGMNWKWVVLRVFFLAPCSYRLHLPSLCPPPFPPPPPYLALMFFTGLLLGRLAGRRRGLCRLLLAPVLLLIAALLLILLQLQTPPGGGGQAQEARPPGRLAWG